MMYRTLTKSLLAASVMLSMQVAKADHLLECPSAAAVSAYRVELALPFAYNAKTKSVNFVSVALDKGASEELAGKGMVLYPVPTSFTDDPSVKTQELMNQLTLETPTPVSYRLGGNTVVPMCVYALPGKNHFTAFLFANDFEDPEAGDVGMKAKAPQKPKNRQEQAMKLIKNMGLTASY